MSRLRFCLVSLLFLVMWCCGVSAKEAEKVPTADFGGVVETTVLENKSQGTNQGLAGALVRIVGTDVTAVTNAQGFFFFKDIPVGRYQLHAVKQGFGEGRGTVEVRQGQRPVTVRLLVNPKGYTQQGRTPVGPGTVYAAFAEYKADQASNNTGFTMPKNLMVYHAALMQGGDFMSLEGKGVDGVSEQEASLDMPMAKSKHSLMMLPPSNPRLTSYKGLSSDPYWVEFSLNGKLYVSTRQQQVQVFDIRNGTRAIKNIPVQGVVTDLTRSPRGEFMLVTVLGVAPGILVVDTRTDAPIAFLQVPAGGGTQPRASVMSLDGSAVYVVTGSSTNGAVYALNAQTGEVLHQASVGASPTDIQLSPDGRFLYVANSASSSVSMMDALSLSEIRRIPVGTAPQKIAVSSNGRQVFVTNKGSNSVSVIDTIPKSVVATIPVSIAPIGVAISPDGSRLYVACHGGRTVVTVDAFAMKPITYTVPQTTCAPYGIAVHP